MCEHGDHHRATQSAKAATVDHAPSQWSLAWRSGQRCPPRQLQRPRHSGRRSFASAAEELQPGTTTAVGAIVAPHNLGDLRVCDRGGIQRQKTPQPQERARALQCRGCEASSLPTRPTNSRLASAIRRRPAAAAASPAEVPRRAASPQMMCWSGTVGSAAMERLGRRADAPRADRTPRPSAGGGRLHAHGTALVAKRRPAHAQRLRRERPGSSHSPPRLEAAGLHPDWQQPVTTQAGSSQSPPRLAAASLQPGWKQPISSQTGSSPEGERLCDSGPQWRRRR